MRIWLIGADDDGIRALSQLRKHPTVDVVVSASSDRPKAVHQGVITRVDRVETVNSANVNTLAKKIRPDLILIDAGALERDLARLTGGADFAGALIQELALESEYPVLVL